MPLLIRYKLLLLIKQCLLELGLIEVRNILIKKVDIWGNLSEIKSN